MGKRYLVGFKTSRICSKHQGGDQITQKATPEDNEAAVGVLLQLPGFKILSNKSFPFQEWFSYRKENYTTQINSHRKIKAFGEYKSF